MIKKYDDFKRKITANDNQKKLLKKKLGGLKKQNIQIKIDRFNQQKREIEKNFNKNVNGPSNYD